VHSDADHQGTALLALSDQARGQKETIFASGLFEIVGLSGEGRFVGKDEVLGEENGVRRNGVTSLLSKYN